MHKELEAQTEKDGCGLIPRKQTPWPRFRLGVPERFATSRIGGQEGQFVTGRKPGKDLVTTYQRPSNGGCWRVNSRSFTEKSHVGVQAVGENHRKATHQARQSFGGFVAHGVATHLSVAGRGKSSGPSIVMLCAMHNPALNLAPFGRWTLRDKAAQRRLALR